MEGGMKPFIDGFLDAIFFVLRVFSILCIISIILFSC